MKRPQPGFVRRDVYREPFSGVKLLAFGLIWIALGVFSVDAALAGRRRAPAGQA